MTDILKEIQSELKEEKFEKLIIQHGSKLVLIAVLAVVVTFFYSFYKKQSAISSMEAGSVFYKAIKSNKIEDFEKVYKKENSGFSALSSMQIAGIQYSKENYDEAKKALLKIIDDKESDKTLVELSKLNLSYIFISEKDYINSEKILKTLTDNSAFKNSARELLATIFINQNKKAEAKILLNNIINDELASNTQKQRANIALNIIQ